MTGGTGRGVVVVMGVIGWFHACVFGSLACMFAVESPHHDVAWMILAALVLGTMLSALPIAVFVYVARRIFTPVAPAESDALTNAVRADESASGRTGVGSH